MPAAAERPRRAWLRALPWIVALGCFSLAFQKIAGGAATEGLSVAEYLRRFFARANWLAWIGLMVPYSILFVLLDAFVTSRAIRWFNAPVRYLDILPVRASAYILALLNEQIGKGAIALYLYRRYRVPLWQGGSSMIFLAFMELYTLLTFASIGVFAHTELLRAASVQLPLHRILPVALGAAAMYFVFHVLYFRARRSADLSSRSRPILHAFERARLRHYGATLLLKAPNVLMAVLIYTISLHLFHVPVEFGRVLAFLPVIFLAAALPLPFHAGALALWAVLFPEFPEVSAFSFVMHSFFVLFNALLGLAFLPSVNRELFVASEKAIASDPPSTPAS